MKTKMNKTISLLLSLFMLLSVVPLTAFANTTNVPDPNRVLSVEVDYNDVYESEIVTVYVKLSSAVDVKIFGAEWTLTYETDKFTFMPEDSDPLDYYSIATGKDPISADAILGTYKFKAIAHETEVTGTFNLTNTSAQTRIEAAENTPVAPTVDPEDVTIILRTNLETDIKVNGSSVGDATEKEVVYKDAGQTVDIIPQLVNQLATEPTNADIEITINGAPVADISTYNFTAVGNYLIEYNVKKIGYEPVDSSFTLKVIEATFDVDAEFNGNTAENGGSTEVKYNEAGYKFIVNSTPDDATIKIGVDNGPEEVRANNELIIKDLGTHTFSYTIERTGYTTATGTYTVTINEADFTEVKATFNGADAVDGGSNAITYDTAAHEFKVTSTPNSTIKITVNGNEETTDTVLLTDAKTYNISYTVSRPSYNTVTGTYTVTINKADFTEVKAEFDGNDAPNAQDTEITYDTAEHIFKVVSSTPDGADVKIRVNGGAEQTTNEVGITDAGTYTIAYAVSKENYTTFNGSYTVRVNEAPITFEAKLGNETVVNGDVKDVTYNASAYQLTITPTIPDDAVVVTTVSKNGATAVDTDPTALNFTDVGSYVVNYTISKANYATATGSIIVNVKAPKYVVEVDLGENTDYVAGKKLVLVYVNSDKVSFTYGDGADKLTMFDVTSKGYIYDNGETFEQLPDTKVFAVVVDPINAGDFNRYKDMVEIVYSPTDSEYVIETPNPVCDLNASDSIDIGDVIAAYATFHGDDAYYPDLMKVVLKADILADKFVNEDDTNACAEAYKSR